MSDQFNRLNAAQLQALGESKEFADYCRRISGLDAHQHGESPSSNRVSQHTPAFPDGSLGGPQQLIMPNQNPSSENLGQSGHYGLQQNRGSTSTLWNGLSNTAQHNTPSSVIQTTNNPTRAMLQQNLPAFTLPPSFPAVGLPTGPRTMNTELASQPPSFFVFDDQPEMTQQLEDSRRSRRSTRYKAFNQPSSSCYQQDRREHLPTPVFKKTVCLIPGYKPTHRPSTHESIELDAQGFLSVPISFHVEDTVSLVRGKIFQNQPLLKSIQGGIQMYYQSGRGNSSTISPFNQPILNGLQLKSCNQQKIYVATLANEKFKRGVALLNCDVQCPNCELTMDLALAKEHYKSCHPPPAIERTEESADEESNLSIASADDSDERDLNAAAALPLSSYLRPERFRRSGRDVLPRSGTLSSTPEGNQRSRSHQRHSQRQRRNESTATTDNQFGSRSAALEEAHQRSRSCRDRNSHRQRYSQSPVFNRSGSTSTTLDEADQGSQNRNHEHSHRRRQHSERGPENQIFHQSGSTSTALEEASQQTQNRQECRGVECRTVALLNSSFETVTNIQLEGLQILLAHRDEFFFKNEIDEDCELAVNKWRFSMSSIKTDLIKASLNQKFLEKIKFPLIVQLKDATSIDEVFNMRCLISALLDWCKKHLPALLNRFHNQSQQEDSIKNQLFCFGLFAGIAVVQCGLCPKFLLNLTLNLINNPGHPFIRGLNVLGVANLIRDKHVVRSVFIDEKVSLNLLSSLFSVKERSSRIEQLAQTHAFSLFGKFLQDLSDDEEHIEIGKVQMKDVFHFVTGYSMVPRFVFELNIVVGFEESDDVEENLPFASPFLNTLTLPLTDSVDELSTSWKKVLQKKNVLDDLIVG